MKRILLISLACLCGTAQEKPKLPVASETQTIKQASSALDDATKRLAAQDAQIKDLTDRALRAELRAAVAEKRLADLQIAQAQKTTIDAQNAAFKASCDAASIPLDKCEPDPKGDWSVRAKVEAPKPEEPIRK